MHACVLVTSGVRIVSVVCVRGVVCVQVRALRCAPQRMPAAAGHVGCQQTARSRNKQPQARNRRHTRAGPSLDI